MVERDSQVAFVVWLASQRRRPDHSASCVSEQGFCQWERRLWGEVCFDLDYSVWVSMGRQRRREGFAQVY